MMEAVSTSETSVSDYQETAIVIFIVILHSTSLALMNILLYDLHIVADVSQAAS
jgi:hypothetical protein